MGSALGSICVYIADKLGWLNFVDEEVMAKYYQIKKESRNETPPLFDWSKFTKKEKE